MSDIRCSRSGVLSEKRAQLALGLAGLALAAGCSSAPLEGAADVGATRVPTATVAEYTATPSKATVEVPTATAHATETPTPSAVPTDTPVPATATPVPPDLEAVVGAADINYRAYASTANNTPLGATELGQVFQVLRKTSNEGMEWYNGDLYAADGTLAAANVWLADIDGKVLSGFDADKVEVVDYSALERAPTPTPIPHIGPWPAVDLGIYLTDYCIENCIANLVYGKETVSRFRARPFPCADGTSMESLWLKSPSKGTSTLIFRITFPPDYDCSFTAENGVELMEKYFKNVPMASEFFLREGVFFSAEPEKKHYFDYRCDSISITIRTQFRY